MGRRFESCRKRIKVPNLMFNFLKSKEDLTFQKFGFIIFNLGIFLLPSTFFFGASLLLIAALIGSFNQEENYFKNNWNKAFFLCGFLLIINAIFQRFFLDNTSFINWDPNLTIVGLGNWLPFFWLFWAFQPFLRNKAKRKIVSIVLLAGTFPVLISGFGQYFFDWTGPFKTLNGLIVWYQKPIGDGYGLTGLFSNQNYAGSWLNIVWPFSIAIFLDRNGKIFNKTSSLFFLISLSLAIVLTNSRNAWGCLITSIPLVIGAESLFWIMPFALFVIMIIFFSTSQKFAGDFQNYLKNIIPETFWMEFNEKRNFDFLRINIFFSALKISLLRPIVGIGAASFTAIYAYQSGFWLGHAHNLFLELAISYGFPVAILFTSTIFLLLFKGFRNLYLTNKNGPINFLDRAWWTSIFVFFISQLFDVQYFDGRISLFIWILLAGLKNIIIE